MARHHRSNDQIGGSSPQFEQHLWRRQRPFAINKLNRVICLEHPLYEKLAGDIESSVARLMEDKHLSQAQVLQRAGTQALRSMDSWPAEVLSMLAWPAKVKP